MTAVPNLYAKAVSNEAAFYAEQNKINFWRTVYVGGGTPSVLSKNDVKTLSSILRKTPPKKNAEITFEANPESVSSEFLDSILDFGANRISLGIQALDDDALSFVNRHSREKNSLDALSLLENVWCGRVCIDFIAGLPFQTENSFKNQFQKIVQFKKIDHVSLYALTVEEETPLFQKIESGKIDYSEEKSDSLWILGRNLLEKNGFFQYEISNFAKKNCESKHNSAYWEQLYDWKNRSAIRWTNTKNLPLYIDFWTNPPFDFSKIPREIEVLDEKSLEFEFFMLGLRMRKGVFEKDFFERFGYSIWERKNSNGVPFYETFDEWKKEKKCGFADGRIFLNRRGILFLNRFLSEIL